MTYSQRKLSELSGLARDTIRKLERERKISPTLNRGSRKAREYDENTLQFCLQYKDDLTKKRKSSCEENSANLFNDAESEPDTFSFKEKNFFDGVVTTPKILQSLKESESESESIPALPDSLESLTLSQHADRIRKLTADVQNGIIKIGFELIAAKKKVGHGGWQDWLKSEFTWSERTARNFISVAQRFGNRQSFAELNTSTLINMLALPEGDEEKFLAEQEAAGHPVSDLSAREVQAAVRQWNSDSSAQIKVSDAESEAETPTPTRKPVIARSTGNFEWFTPSEYLAAARRVLGTIDLDPASSDFANQTVKAEKYFTADSDGLLQSWGGKIWLNPPFKAGLIEKFVDKLLASDFEAAIVLTDNCTDTQWFRRLASGSDVILFTTGRINFIKSDGTQDTGSHFRGQAFFYIGAESEKFIREFRDYGWLVKYCGEN